jgi:hypothetical protein
MDVMQQVRPPAIPFIIPYMQDLLEIDQSSNSFEPEDTEFIHKTIHFQKYYHLFSIAAELETFRLAPYSTQLKGDRETNSMFVQHIKHIGKWDDGALGIGTQFSTGTVPESNNFMTSAQGVKAIKKILTMISSSPTKD